MRLAGATVFLALGVPGILFGGLVYFTVREPKRGRLDCNRSRPALAARNPEISLEPARRLPRHDGHGGDGALGLGTDLVDPNVPDT